MIVSRQARFLVVATFTCIALGGCLAAEIGGGEEEIISPVMELDQAYFLLADDILLDRENPEQLQWAQSMLALYEQGETEEGVRQASAVRKLKTKLWPKSTVTYHFTSSVPAKDRAFFKQTVQKYAEVSSLKFVESPTGGSYIYTIKRSNSKVYGGRSTLGYTKNAWMEYSNTIHILHEVGHGIGLHHEHQRPDRDSFIQVNWAAIPSHYQSAFAKLSGVQSSKAYDYESVMHYGPDSSSFYGKAFTIKKTSKPTAGNPAKVGQRTYLSPQDEAFVAELYPDNQHPITGYVDGIAKEKGQALLRGWACAKGLAQSIQVHLYRDGPAGKGGSFVGGYAADQASEPAVAQACGVDQGAYRFRIPIAESLRQDHAGELIYVHGISPTGDANLLLSKSGEHTIPPVAYLIEPAPL